MVVFMLVCWCLVCEWLWIVWLVCLMIWIRLFVGFVLLGRLWSNFLMVIFEVILFVCVLFMLLVMMNSGVCMKKLFLLFCCWRLRFELVYCFVIFSMFIVRS